MIKPKNKQELMNLPRDKQFNIVIIEEGQAKLVADGDEYEYQNGDNYCTGAME
jgi:hypothetical protein